MKTKVSADDLSGLCVTRGIKVFLWSVNASKAKDIRYIPYYKRGIKNNKLTRLSTSSESYTLYSVLDTVHEIISSPLSQQSPVSQKGV